MLASRWCLRLPPSVTEDELVKFIYAADDTASMASAARTARGYLAALSLGGAGLTPEFEPRYSSRQASGPFDQLDIKQRRFAHNAVSAVPWSSDWPVDMSALDLDPQARPCVGGRTKPHDHSTVHAARNAITNKTMGRSGKERKPDHDLV